VRIRSALALVAGLLALSLLPSAASAASSLPSGFQDTTVFENLAEPSTFRFAPDPDERVFVAEKSGRILVFDNLDDATPTVFADIRTKVFDRGDRGLLGLALDPQFDSGRPYVYALYTYDHVLGDSAPPPKWGEPNHTGDACADPDGADDCLVSGRLVRMTAAGDQAVGGVGSPDEKVLAEGWCQQFSSHSIGDLEFGPEGDLYVSGGDGASFENVDYGQYGDNVPNPCGDPPAGKGGTEELPDAEGGALRSLNLKLLNGKVLRIDPDTGKGVSGNPRFGFGDENEERILAEGFRNPFRFAIDPATDEVYVGNVGWAKYEEIDRFAGSPGSIYSSGWPCFEDEEWTEGYGGLGLDVCEALYATPGSAAAPLFAYSHTSGVTEDDPCHLYDGSAIAGLEFYEGGQFPAAYKGALFFSDPVRSCIYVMFSGSDGRPDPSTTVAFLVNGGVYPGIDVQEGPEGNLFYAKLLGEGGLGTPGSIHRISYASGNQPPIAHLSVDHESSPGNLSANFDATGSTDADGEALSYEWDPDGDGGYSAPSSIGTETVSFSDASNHTVAVRVRDQQGATSVDRVTVYPHDTPPEPTIVTPADPAGFRWSVGEKIQFAGSATDHEDGNLPGTKLDWSSNLLHCPFSGCHAHPLQAFPAVASGVLDPPAHELPSHIELLLRATDSRGLSATRAIDLYPRELSLHIDSVPSGLTLSAGPLTKQTPFDLPTIAGSRITLSAPATATFGGTDFGFDSWSDGGSRAHVLHATCSGSYLARFVAGGLPSAAGAANVEADCQPAPQPEPERPEEAAPDQQPPAPAPKPPVAVALVSHPLKRSRQTTARFAFSADQSGAEFRCQLDAKPAAPCSSPRSYRHLRPGPHRFEVVAVAAGGVSESQPATYGWKVLCPRSQALVHGRCLASPPRSRHR
jgi:glucose/arabinose dehydrogenase